jgi:hypothetical protein
MLRAKMKEELAKITEAENNLDLLEAGFVIKCNDQFHIICDKVKDKTGKLDSERIFFEWNEWLKKEVKKEKKSSELDFENLEK